jgi:hypothetical protein
MAAAKGIFFGGRSILKPGAYAVFDASRLVPNRLSPANTLAIVAQAKGGDPSVVHTVNSLQEARGIIREGTALDLLRLSYNPSGDVQGAGKTQFVRLNAAVQATLNLEDITPEAVVLVTSKDYGELNNNIRVKVESGTNVGKKVTVQDTSPDREVLEVGDDLGPMFTIQYSGASEDSLLDVVKTGDNATSLTLDTSGQVTPVPTDDLTLDLTLLQFNNINKIIEFIDGHPSYTAALVDQADGSLPSEKLDAQASQATKASPFTLTANIGAIENYFDRFSQLVDVTRVATKTATPENIAFTFLTGGSEGAAPDATRWQNQLALLEDVEAAVVIGGTEDVAIMTLILAHAEAMSDVKAKRERIALSGGGVGLTPDNAIANALELTSPYMSHVYPGIKTRNLETGDLEIKSPMHSAALVAGMVAGVAPSTSVTNKTIRVGGLERLLTLTEIEKLLDGGVTPLEFVQNEGVFKVVQGLTTYLKDANVILRKIIGIRVANFIIQELRNSAEPFVGETSDKTTIQSLRNALVAKLNLLIRRPGNPNGVLTEGVDENGEDQPAFRNLVVDFDGLEVATVTVDVSPVGEIAYIPITANLIPNRIRIAA